MEYDYSRPELFGPIHSKGYVTTPPKQLKQPLENITRLHLMNQATGRVLTRMVESVGRSVLASTADPDPHRQPIERFSERNSPKD
jgi:hypothetical protein